MACDCNKTCECKEKIVELQSIIRDIINDDLGWFGCIDNPDYRCSHTELILECPGDLDEPCPDRVFYERLQKALSD